MHIVPNFSVNDQTKVIVLDNENIQRLMLFLFLFFTKGDLYRLCEDGCIYLIFPL